MGKSPDMAERIGTTINQLDIDFSQLSLVGWGVSLASFVAGGGAAYVLCGGTIRRSRLDAAVGMVFFLTMFAVTTVTFVILRGMFGSAGFSITKSGPIAGDGVGANRDALKRMSDGGMDMNVVHAIDFWHHFKMKENADMMSVLAREASWNVVSVEANEERGGYDVQVRVELVPSLDAITTTEQSLARLAERCNGYADDWGVRQSD